MMEDQRTITADERKRREIHRRPIPVKEAVHRVMERVRRVESEAVTLQESHGRILAEPIAARHDVPPWHRSPYDGFAIRSEDSWQANEGQRVQFRVIEHLGAGDVARAALSQGEAARIMTGAPLPSGADAVVMLEQASESADGTTFMIRRPFAPLENVSLQGEDARRGEVLVDQGERIHPGTIALMATFGYARVRVARKPIVGILSTGSELLEVDEELIPGAIRNSNGPMIAAQLARIGVEARSFGIMRDDLESCYTLVKQALEETDCLITTGGVSVGDFDYMPAIYERLGAEVLFNKVAMRPGSVTTVAAVDGKLLFGLSGNPSACYIGFELYARPALLKMTGNSRPYLPRMQAMLAEDHPGANPFTRFVRAIVHYDGHQPTVGSAGFNKSNAVTSIARGNALMVLPGGTRGMTQGTKVDVLVLGTDGGDSVWRI